MKNNKNLSNFKTQRHLKNILLETVNAVKSEEGRYPTNLELASYINQIAGDMVTVEGMEEGVAVSDVTLSSFAKQLTEGCVDFYLGFNESFEIGFDLAVSGGLLTEETTQTPERLRDKIARVGNSAFPNFGIQIPRLGGEAIGGAVGSYLGGTPGEFLGTMAGGKLASHWQNRGRVQIGKTPLPKSMTGWRPGGAAGFMLGGRVGEQIGDYFGMPLVGNVAGAVAGDIAGNALQAKYGERIARTVASAAEPLTTKVAGKVSEFATKYPNITQMGSDVKNWWDKKVVDAWDPQGASARQAARDVAAETRAAARTAATASGPVSTPASEAIPMGGTTPASSTKLPGSTSVKSGALEVDLGAGSKAASRAAGEGAAEAAAKTVGTEVGEAALKAGTKAAAKGVAKGALKAIPGIGLAAGLYFGAKRALEGDWAGAALDVGAGAAGMIPGVGTAASLALTGGLVAHDIYKSQQSSSASPNPNESPYDNSGSTRIRNQSKPFGPMNEEILNEVNLILIENIAGKNPEQLNEFVGALLRALERNAAKRIGKGAGGAIERGAGEAIERGAGEAGEETIRTGGIEIKPSETPRLRGEGRARGLNDAVRAGTAGAIASLLLGGRSLSGVYSPNTQMPGDAPNERIGARSTEGIRTFDPSTGAFTYIPMTSIV